MFGQLEEVNHFQETKVLKSWNIIDLNLRLILIVTRRTASCYMFAQIRKCASFLCLLLVEQIDIFWIISVKIGTLAKKILIFRKLFVILFAQLCRLLVDLIVFVVACVLSPILYHLDKPTSLTDAVFGENYKLSIWSSSLLSILIHFLQEQFYFTTFHHVFVNPLTYVKKNIYNRII